MRIEYENKWFRVLKDGKYHYLQENGSDNGAVVLALIDGCFIFVQVQRAAQGMELIEAPRGYGNPGELSEDCALRELFEETGHCFDKEDLQLLGNIRPNSAILSSCIPVYLIETAAREPLKAPDGEVTTLVSIDKDAVKSVVAQGKITDGITLAALALYWSRN